MSKSFDDLLSKVRQCSKKTLSVACAQDEAVLEAVSEAHSLGIVDAVLVGDEAKIRDSVHGLASTPMNIESSMNPIR